MFERRAFTAILGSVVLALLARPDLAADEAKAPEPVKPTGSRPDLPLLRGDQHRFGHDWWQGGEPTRRSREPWWYMARAGTMSPGANRPPRLRPTRTRRACRRKPRCSTPLISRRTVANEQWQAGGGATRPLMFIYNGGPGSATLWLHMGAFGPRRVVVREDGHTPPAPYPVVNNAYSLLDVADLVFIDAPGAGFSRIAGKDKEKAFWGVDNDAHAFARFIQQFLNKYGRWNSPKYLFGESYGTTRSAVLANELASSASIDLNGVILLSTILNFDLSVDSPSFNPGIDSAYVTALPTMAATAWYHNRLPGKRPAELEPFLREVETVCDQRLRRGLAAGRPAGSGRAPEDRRATLRLPGHAGRLPAQVRPQGQRRAVLAATADARRPDYRAHRHPLLRSQPRPPEQGSAIRSDDHLGRIGLRRGMERLCALDPALSRGRRIQDLRARCSRPGTWPTRHPACRCLSPGRPPTSCSTWQR